MSSPHERLVELGLRLPAVAPPVGAYLPAVRSGGLIFTSGQLPMVDGALTITGSVGDDADAHVSPEQATVQARLCALNALAAIDSLVGLAEVRRVVKVVGYVACRPGFFGFPAVVNGASELLTAVFGDDGRHARSAVGVAALPLAAPVEIEVVVEIDPIAELAELAADEAEFAGVTDLSVASPPPSRRGEPEPA